MAGTPIVKLALRLAIDVGSAGGGQTNQRTSPMLKTFVAAQARLAVVKDRIKTLQDDESGAALVEYALLVGLIAVAAAAFIPVFAQNVNGAFTRIGAHMAAVQ